jgi:hypothetical protein
MNFSLPSFILHFALNKKNPGNAYTVHIMLCIVDHFEPANGGVNADLQERRVKAWVEGYPKFAERYRDVDGKMPQHSWFYPPHHDHRFLKDLVKLCKDGYGEIEMHLHHNHMKPFPDNTDTLRDKIIKCINDYSKYGIFCLPDGSKRFAFIHGDWSLDNSRGSQFCGINNEISILKECGCYADFTFPSLCEAQPAMMNKLYYVKDNPRKPKSYNWGRQVMAGVKREEDLLMVTGILGLRWKSRTHRFKPSIETSNIDKTDKLTPGRIDYLVKHAIRIKGQPNWVFIKLHTHGAIEKNFDSLFGNHAAEGYSFLLGKYNDRKKYFLHFVTAREMYNIIKAAEAGEKDNPGKYREYLIPKYNYSGY